MKSIAIAAACQLVLAATVSAGTDSTGPLAAPAAEDRLCFDFEKDLQGWHVVVGDLHDHRQKTFKCPKQARLPETEKFLIASGHRVGGILESPVFSVKGTEATFLLGGSGKPHAYLSLHAEDGREIMRSEVEVEHPRKGDPWRLHEKKWDLSQCVGKNVFLRLVSEPVGYSLGRSGGSGHLHQEIFFVFDSFTVKGAIDEAASNKRRAWLDDDYAKSMDAIAAELGDIVFKDKDDPDYRTLLTYVEALHEALNRNKRFDMPGFRPNPHYVRELKRYGLIPKDFDRLKDPIDVYATDRAYWESIHYKPVQE